MDQLRTDSRAPGPLPRPRWLYPAILAGFCVLFYLPYFFTATTNLLPTYQDESQWWLYTLFTNSSFARGFFPLWTPDLACGMPFLAWSHSAPFYPTNLVFALLEFGRAFWVVQLLHHLLFTLGLYWLCRRLCASPGAALLACLIAAAQFVNGPLAGFLPTLRTAAWGPLWMLCFHGLLLERRLRWLLGFALITGVMFLGGQVEMIGLGWELLGVCALAAGIIAWRRDGLRPLLASAALFVVAFALSYLLSQAQALPTLELTHFSIRGRGITYGYFRNFSGWPNFTVWLPFLLTGVTAAGLAAGLAGARRSSTAAVLAVGLLFCTALIMNLFWIMRVMYLVPVARGLLAHSRIHTFLMVLAPALMALGFDAMLAPAARRKWLRVTGLIGLIMTPAFLYVMVYHSELLIMGEQSGIESATALVGAIKFALVLALPVYLLLAVRPAWAAARSRLAWGMMTAVVLAVLAAPAIWSMPRTPVVDPFHISPAYAKYFEAHRELYRTQVIYPWDRWERIHIPVQSGIYAGTRSADAFITVSLDRYTRLIGSFLPDAIHEQDGYIGALLATKVLKDSTITKPQNLPLLNLLGIKYLVTEQANLRSPTAYFLAYPDSDLARSPGVKLEPEDVAVFDGRAAMRLQFSAGDELFFLARTPTDRWVMATTGNGKSSRLAAAKFVRVRWTASGMMADGDGVGVLEFAALPPGPEPTTLVSPQIRNIKKHFRRLDDPGLGASPFNVFENPTALPAAFIPEKVVELDRDEALPWVRANAEPGQRAVVEDALAPSPSPLSRGESVEVVDYSPERVTLKVTAARPRLVVLRDSIFPGWEMTVNGRPERIRAADYAFRGVPVGRGQSRVEMVYRPASFRLGMWITLVSLACLAAAAVRRRS